MLRADKTMLPRLAAILGCGLLALAGCRTKACPMPAKPVTSEACKPSAEAVPAGWTLQFSDTFQRAELGPDWSISNGPWAIVDGKVAGHGQLMCTRKFPGSQRVEFDATATTDKPCDLSAVLNSDPIGELTGYFFGFGSDNNAYSMLMLHDAQVRKCNLVITPSTTYHIVCERDGTVLRHFIDGKMTMTYTDADPLRGPKHDLIGLYMFTDGKMSNVKVYTKPDDFAPAPLPPAAAEAPTGWTLQFSDSFQRAELGTDWTFPKAEWVEWSVENGWLKGYGDIACTRKFPGSQRLEFDAMSLNPCDLSGYIGANASGLATGYYFGFGAENNAFSQLLIHGVLAKKYPAVVTAGKIHHVVCERDGATLRHIVDGNVTLTCTDPNPLIGPDHEMVGFYVYTSGRIANVRVYTKP